MSKYIDKRNTENKILIIFLLVLLFSTNTYSATTNSLWEFKGNLVVNNSPTATCYFSVPSGGTTLDFGTVYWQDITGDTYKRTIDTKLVCSNLTKNTVSLRARPQMGIASFNSNAIATSNKDLGILFHNSNSSLNLGTNYTISNSSVALTATLIKNTSTVESSISTGSFDAYSVFEVSYE